MLVLSGKLAELPVLPGTPWHASRYQRGADVNGSLVVVGPGPGDETMLLVTAYDIDDATFEQLSREWTSWWEELIRAS